VVAPVVASHLILGDDVERRAETLGERHGVAFLHEEVAVPRAQAVVDAFAHRILAR
jgi:hypothetical protein